MFQLHHGNKILLGVTEITFLMVSEMDDQQKNDVMEDKKESSSKVQQVVDDDCTQTYDDATQAYDEDKRVDQLNVSTISGKEFKTPPTREVNLESTQAY